MKAKAVLLLLLLLLVACSKMKGKKMADDYYCGSIGKCPDGYSCYLLKWESPTQTPPFKSKLEVMGYMANKKCEHAAEGSGAYTACCPD